MKDISIADIINMQEELWEKHKNSWKPILPEYGKDYFLWMIEEIGECISIIKKKGNIPIMSDATVRTAFVEEMSDILMYYAEIMRRYKISSEELADIVIQKHKRNMQRDFAEEYKKFLAH